MVRVTLYRPGGFGRRKLVAVVVRKRGRRESLGYIFIGGICVVLKRDLGDVVV